MDLSQLKDAAIEATARALQDKFGVAPDEDSDEWEEEYRRQFALAKERYGVTVPTVARAAGPALPLPPLRGDTQEAIHWGEQVRAERLREVTDASRRAWMAKTWTRAKLWTDTREVPIATLLQRTQGQYDDYRRQQAEQQKAQGAAARGKAAALAAYQAKLKAAGVTEAGLVELIDLAERTKPAPLVAKIADLNAPDRHLRVFTTADPASLLVKEKNLKGQVDYGIERDDGLVADLTLFAAAP
ncbi:MAG: hypothetical protein JO032_06395 [Alphaproteobacteria bacterium]|nr:hypothetical protein [Alphaproteobacteria bacterium]